MGGLIDQESTVYITCPTHQEKAPPTNQFSSCFARHQRPLRVDVVDTLAFPKTAVPRCIPDLSKQGSIEEIPTNRRPKTNVDS